MGGVADRIGVRRIIDTKRLATIQRDVRMEPCHSQLRVSADDHLTGRLPLRIEQNVQGLREISLDHIARHTFTPTCVTSPEK